MKSCFVTVSFISQLKWIDKHRYTEELHICWCVYFCFGNSGRRITSSGQRDLDQVAGRIVVAPWSSNVELCYNCLTLGFSFNPVERCDCSDKIIYYGIFGPNCECFWCEDGFCYVAFQWLGIFLSCWILFLTFLESS
jgi:hypothetical protein